MVSVVSGVQTLPLQAASRWGSRPAWAVLRKRVGAHSCAAAGRVAVIGWFPFFLPSFSFFSFSGVCCRLRLDRFLR